MRLEELRQIVLQQTGGDTEELLSLLEIGAYDIVERFSDRLLEHKEKFGVVDHD